MSHYVIMYTSSTCVQTGVLACCPNSGPDLYHSFTVYSRLCILSSFEAGHIATCHSAFRMRLSLARCPKYTLSHFVHICTLCIHSQILHIATCHTLRVLCMSHCLPCILGVTTCCTHCARGYVLSDTLCIHSRNRKQYLQFHTRDVTAPCAFTRVFSVCLYRYLLYSLSTEYARCVLCHISCISGEFGH